MSDQTSEKTFTVIEYIERKITIDYNKEEKTINILINAEPLITINEKSHETHAGEKLDVIYIWDIKFALDISYKTYVKGKQNCDNMFSIIVEILNYYNYYMDSDYNWEKFKEEFDRIILEVLGV